MKLPISVVLLTHNEENNISACLESCSFAGEIIVVDDDSSDRTVEIAKSFDGVRLFHRALNGDFGAQKSFGVTQATNEWIFLIDADERVTAQLAEFIKKVVCNGEKFCYWVQRENHFKNMIARHGTMRPDWVPRLMPKEGVKVSGCVHEAVISPLPKRKAVGRLIHFSYTSWDQFYEKQNLYSRLAAKKLQEQNRPCNFLSHVFFIQSGRLSRFISLTWAFWMEGLDSFLQQIIIAIPYQSMSAIIKFGIMMGNYRKN